MTITTVYGKGQIDYNYLRRETMIPTALPFEYLHYLDRHDRVLRMGRTPVGSLRTSRRGRRTRSESSYEKTYAPGPTPVTKSGARLSF